MYHTVYTKHGMSGSATYIAWANMRARCLNKRHPRYKMWGGRGITVCKRWRTFPEFLADMGARPAGMTLDRIDNDRGYEPGNCRWATYSQQNLNKRPRRDRA